jgi:hypothetical protein
MLTLPGLPRHPLKIRRLDVARGLLLRADNPIGSVAKMEWIEEMIEEMTNSGHLHHTLEARYCGGWWSVTLMGGPVRAHSGEAKTFPQAVKKLYKQWLLWKDGPSHREIIDGIDKKMEQPC